MNIAFTADWHLEGPVNHTAFHSLVRKLVELEPEIIVVAGDVGEGEAFSTGLEVLGRCKGVKLLVPGNHDLMGSSVTGYQRYSEELPGLVSAAGFQLLDQQPWIAPDGDLAIVGTMNWFDFTFVEKDRLTSEEWAECLRPGRRASEFALGLPDEQFALQLATRCQEQLASLPASVKQTIAVTHYPAVRQMVLNRKPSPQGLRFLARCGNTKLERALLEDARVTRVVCGHTHSVAGTDTQHLIFRGKHCHNLGGGNGSLRLLQVSPLTGRTRWWECNDLVREVQPAAQFV